MWCPDCGYDFSDSVVKTCPECGHVFVGAGPLSRAIGWVEVTVISIMLCAMVLLVLAQIGLRNFYSSGITGGFEIVRQLVLWVAFLSAGLAARDGKHIKIDVIYRILPDRMKKLAEVVTGLFTAIVSGLLLYAALQFIRSDYSAGTEIVFFSCAIPVWVFESIIPVGYCTVMLRYAYQCKQSFMAFIKGNVGGN